MNANAKREQYLYDFLNWAHEDIFREFDPQLTPPPYRLACGQAPNQRQPRKGRVLGTCFPRSASSDGHNEIFVCPTESDTANMLATVLHEYIHAIDDNKSGHTGRFAKIARGIGMAGKMTETIPGAELKELLDWYIQEHGDIPAGHLKAGARNKPKQGTRMIKVDCPACKFMVRTSAKHVETWRQAGRSCPIWSGLVTIHD